MLNRITVAAAALMLSTVCTASAQVMPQVMHVPFRMEHGLPTITARVDGKPVSLILDLGGGSALALKTTVLDAMVVSFTGKTREFRNYAGAITHTRDFIARLFVSSGLVLHEVAGNELIRPGPFPWDGYLGLGTLKQYLVVFDYPDHELRLYPSGAQGAMRKECGDAHLPIKLDGVVQSKVTTDHGVLTFAWGTGSNLNIVRPSAIGAKTSIGADGSPSAVTFSRFIMGGKNFGPVRLTLMPFTEPAVDGFIGSPFMQSRVVCIDPGAGVAAIR